MVGEGDEQKSLVPWEPLSPTAPGSPCGPESPCGPSSPEININKYFNEHCSQIPNQGSTLLRLFLYEKCLITSNIPSACVGW